MKKSVQELYENAAIGETINLSPTRQSSAALGQFQDEVTQVRSLKQKGLVETFGEHISSEEGIDWLDMISFTRLR
ncbi:hypothetical protein [Massilia oculi]|uniref:hypothetical protein n=1 Tax=Massilia oculi TaxID=945844 RepID=UPI001AAE5BE8|nr:hypothetical protein [Massilia oculi]